MRGLLKKCIYSICALIILIILYSFVLSAVRYIPNELRKENAEKSIKLLEEEGAYYYPFGIPGMFFDNQTDCILINSAITNDPNGTIYCALNNAYTIPEGTENSWYREQSLDGAYCALNGSGTISSYSRYWAGMSAILRVWLCFADLGMLRFFLFLIETVLLLAVLSRIYNRLKIYGVISFLFLLFWRGPLPILGVCLAYSTDYILMLSNILLVDKLFSKQRVSCCLLFVVLGSIQCFINYYSFPLISIAVPLIYYMTVSVLNNTDEKLYITSVAKWGGSWISGYVITLLSKQILARSFMGSESGIDQMIARMGGTSSVLERTKSAFEFWSGRSNGYVVTMRIMLIAYLIVFCFINFRNISVKANRVRSFWVCLFIPFVYHFVMIGHSGHGFSSINNGVTAYVMGNMLILLLASKLDTGRPYGPSDE